MNQLPTPRRTLASLLAAANLALAVTGCTSVDMNLAQGPSGDAATSAVAVRVFDRAKDVEAGHTAGGRVASELATGSGETIHRAEGSAWSRDGLASGEYLLTVRQWAKGNAIPESPTSETSRHITLHPGERLSVDVVSRGTSAWTVVGVSAAVIGVLVVIGALAMQNTSLLDERPTEPLPAGVAAHGPAGPAHEGSLP